MPAVPAPRASALVVSAALSAALVSGAAAAGPAAAAPGADRVHGPDRYATAVALSQRTAPAGATTVVLASGEGFADALAGAPAAAAVGGPLLLTPRAGLPPVVRAELVRLEAVEAIVLGGEAAVAPAVVAELEELGIMAERVSGEDRYDTAALLAVDVVAPQPLGPPEEVLVASGEGFADALAGGAYGAATGSPLLLTAAGSLPPATAAVLEALDPGSVTVLGGPSVVSPAVEAQLDAHTAGRVTRVQGGDRYETAARVVERFPAGARAATPLLASGRSFPDALAGAALGAPLLLGEPGCLPAATTAALAALGAGSVTALGGTAALGDAAASGAPCRAD